MAKAITYNNAGVVEAIKRNSGSTKFYKASYQGIIEALEDWGGGGGSGGGGGTSVLPPGTNLPNTDNNEGDLVVVPNGDGDYFMYVFADGNWERLHITTEEVETAGSAPFALVTDDGVTVKNQKDINAYLDQRITTLSEKGYDDGPIREDLTDLEEKVDQEIADREAGDAALLVDIAEENKGRTDADAALQDQIDALEAYDDEALTLRVDDLEEAVEALPLTIDDEEPEGEDGDLWFKSTEEALQLFVRYGGEWVVASPPVSTDDIESIATNAEATAQEARQMAELVDWKLHQQSELITWDQERQDKAILTLEGEIEQLAPSFERGQWNWDDGDGYAEAGEYVMRGEMTQDEYDYLCEPWNQIYSDCLREAGQDNSARTQCSREYDENIKDIPKPGDSITTNKWELTTEVEFSNQDARGELHTFEDVKVGQIIDMVCEHGGYMVGEITEITPGMWYENAHLKYKVLTAKGEAKGLTKLKIFTIDDTVDSDDFHNFVRKTGDSMTGHLEVTNPDRTDGTYLFSVKAEGLPDDGKKVAFRVTADGKVKAGHDTSHAFIASANNDVVTKKFTDDKLVKKSGDKMTGTLTISKEAQDNPTNSFIINQFVKQPDGSLKSEVLLKDYKPQKTADYKSSIFYYGLCDNDKSIVNRGYANSSYFRLDEKNQTKGPIWIRPSYDDNGTEKVRGGASAGNMLIVNQESDKGSIVRFQQKGDDVFKLEIDKKFNLYRNPIFHPGDIQIAKNHDWVIKDDDGKEPLKVYANGTVQLSNLKDPTHDQDACTRAYADKVGHKIAPFQWRYKKGATEANLQSMEFTGPENPKFNDGKKHTFMFHKDCLNHNHMDFYKVGYHQYYQMGRKPASIWFDSGNDVWKWKGEFYIRDIWWGTTTNSNVFKIQTHSDFDDNTNYYWPSSLTDRGLYYLKIAGMF